MFLRGRTSVFVTSEGKSVSDINSKRLETVVSIEITNDVSQLGANCEITVPLNVRIQNEGQYLIDNVRNLFKSGDFIEIYAFYLEYAPSFNESNKDKRSAYEGVPEIHKVFEGFILDYLEGSPLKMRCLDYIYKLRTGNVFHMVGGKKVNGLSYQKSTIKKVLEDILKDTGITIIMPMANFEIVNMTFINQSPAACLEMLRSDLSFMLITLVGKKLYFNIAKNTINYIKLKSDINVNDCRMQKPDAAFKKFKVQVWLKNEKGKKELVEVGDADGEIRQASLYNIKVTNKQAEQYGKDSLDNIKLGHYNGKILTRLYPEVNLLDAVEYTDIRYKERSGVYTVRGMVLTLDESGFQRELTVSYLRNI